MHSLEQQSFRGSAKQGIITEGDGEGQNYLRNYALDTPTESGRIRGMAKYVKKPRKVEQGSLLEPHFTDEDKAREFLEALRWPDGAVCRIGPCRRGVPHSGSGKDL